MIADGIRLSKLQMKENRATVMGLFVFLTFTEESKLLRYYSAAVPCREIIANKMYSFIQKSFFSLPLTLPFFLCSISGRRRPVQMESSSVVRVWYYKTKIRPWKYSIQ